MQQSEGVPLHKRTNRGGTLINGIFLTPGYYLGKSIDCGMEIRWEIILGEKSQIAANGSHATFGPICCLIYISVLT
jgi:hypothetical protein